MILTSMPDLPPRPLTSANAAFRRLFYDRWGRENAIICGRSSDAQYETHPQTLSIKTAWGGRERYFLREREVAVDDDHWLVLNEGRAYGSRLKSVRPTASFSIFFRPGLQQEVAAALALPLDAALDEPAAGRADVRFAEHLRSHGDPVSRRVRALRDAVLAGERNDDWLDQQLLLLLGQMLMQERRDAPAGGAAMRAPSSNAACGLRPITSTPATPSRSRWPTSPPWPACRATISCATSAPCTAWRPTLTCCANAPRWHGACWPRVRPTAKRDMWAYSVSKLSAWLIFTVRP